MAANEIYDSQLNLLFIIVQSSLFFSFKNCLIILIHVGNFLKQLQMRRSFLIKLYQITNSSIFSWLIRVIPFEFRALFLNFKSLPKLMEICSNPICSLIIEVHELKKTWSKHCGEKAILPCSAKQLTTPTPRSSSQHPTPTKSHNLLSWQCKQQCESHFYA